MFNNNKQISECVKGKDVKWKKAARLSVNVKRWAIKAKSHRITREADTINRLHIRITILLFLSSSLLLLFSLVRLVSFEAHFYAENMNTNTKQCPAIQQNTANKHNGDRCIGIRTMNRFQEHLYRATHSSLAIVIVFQRTLYGNKHSFEPKWWMDINIKSDCTPSRGCARWGFGFCSKSSAAERSANGYLISD